MKPILRSSALLALSAVIAFSGSVLADDTSSAPTKPAAAGSPGSQDSKNQENTPAGPANQSGATTGTPQQTKTGDTATTDKDLSNGSPNEATKKAKHKKHHHTTQEASQTNTTQSGGMDNK